MISQEERILVTVALSKDIVYSIDRLMDEYGMTRRMVIEYLLRKVVNTNVKN